MENYGDVAKGFFKDVLSTYDLVFIGINTHRFALVGHQFAISIFISLDGVTLDYLAPNADGTLDEFWVDTFISKEFSEEDRMGIGNPKTIHESIIAELKISANGLKNHWKSMLQGDKSWMESFMALGGTIRKASDYVVEVLAPIFNQQ